MRRIGFVDTTLRDGEQTPDVRFSIDEKVRIAVELERLGIDIIECGFPVTSPGDAEAVRRLSAVIRHSQLRPISRLVKGDIDAAYEAVRHAARPRFSTFTSTSALQIKYKLNSTPEAVLERTSEIVRYAVSKGVPVDFAAVDASRSDMEYLTEVFRRAHEAGAQYLIVCDSVGYCTPKEFYDMIRHLRERLPEAKLSAHTHDDLGMAVANSLAAIEAGADMVEGTVNGLGERAGNAALDEVIMSLRVKQSFYQADVSQIRTEHLTAISRMVAELSGVGVAPTKAVVGENAFRHESGIHQDAVLKNPLTYHVMTPEEVGQSMNALVMGKHSGRHAFRRKLELLGCDVPETALDACFQEFKRLCDRTKVVADRDIIALAQRFAAARQ